MSRPSNYPLNSQFSAKQSRDERDLNLPKRKTHTQKYSMRTSTYNVLNKHRVMVKVKGRPYQDRKKCQRGLFCETLELYSLYPRFVIGLGFRGQNSSKCKRPERPHLLPAFAGFISDSNRAQAK